LLQNFKSLRIYQFEIKNSSSIEKSIKNFHLDFSTFAALKWQ